MKSEKATFGMGCFWSPQALFDHLPGVEKTEVGYMGGDEKKYPNPTYQQVCSNQTGYAEVVHITFNPKKISYQQLLKVFWENHNPTTMNRQGPDIGTQYRSAVFYHTEEQKELAEKTKAGQQKVWDAKKIILGKKKIVTEIKKTGTFFPAEEYHQKYLEKRGLESCHI